MNLIKNKKVGIWGLGIVGTSALEYVRQLTDQIQVLDQKPHPNIPVTIQTPESLQDFLNYNDIIIPSPGISLLRYAAYQHKFLCELDIFASHYDQKTIAITGTLGKTTVTSFIEQCIPGSVAAGNIGYPMLSVLSQDIKPDTVVLELSSYQLQYAKNFAPDIAIWTNFYPNHLDHHATIDEYFLAKCAIFAHQKSHQIALIPAELIDQIESRRALCSQVYLFATTKPSACKYPTFYIDHNAIVLQQHDDIRIIFDDVTQLPSSTFTQNWVCIIAAVYLHNVDMHQVAQKINHLKAPEHRVEYVNTIHRVEVYNDSKSTVWQATQSAIKRFPGKRIALFLGGLSKGTDRTPLIEYLSTQSVTVFSFGSEAAALSKACATYQVPHQTASTLDEALSLFLSMHDQFDILLFSPAGSSFDLFKNYEDRGTQFKKMMYQIEQSLRDHNNGRN